MWRITFLSQRYFRAFLNEHRGKPCNAYCSEERFASSEVEEIRRILDPAGRVPLFFILYTEIFERPLGPYNDGSSGFRESGTLFVHLCLPRPGLQEALASQFFSISISIPFV